MVTDTDSTDPSAFTLGATATSVGRMLDSGLRHEAGSADAAEWFEFRGHASVLDGARLVWRGRGRVIWRVVELRREFGSSRSAHDIRTILRRGGLDECIGGTAGAPIVGWIVAETTYRD